MSLIKCKECDSDISDKAPACPKCGCPQIINKSNNDKIENSKKNKNVKFRFFMIFFYLTIILACIWFIWSTLTLDNKDELKKITQSIIKQPITVIDKTIQIREDQYYVVPVEMNERGDIFLEYKISSGPALDVFCLNEENYKKWEEGIKSLFGKEFKYLSELSSLGVKEANISATVTPRTYYFIFDNTDYGPTSPPMNMKDDIITTWVRITKK